MSGKPDDFRNLSGGSGTPQARDEQVAIIKLLLASGAQVTDRDGCGKQVDEAASGDSVLAALRG